MVNIQVVYNLMDEFGVNGPTWDWNRKYPEDDNILEAVVRDLAYMTSKCVVEQFSDEKTELEGAEEYLKMMRNSDEIARALGLDPNNLSRDQYETLEASIMGNKEGLSKAIVEYRKGDYQKKSGEEPTIDTFVRNARLALWHVQESPQYQPLLHPLQQYITFLQSITPKN